MRPTGSFRATMATRRCRCRKGCWLRQRRFEGIEDRTAAEALRGKGLYVARTQLPPLEPGVYYQADLIGLEVIAGNQRLGRVSQLVNFGGGDLLEIEKEGADRLLVPFTGAKVDLTGRVITVDLPKGFLDEP